MRILARAEIGSSQNFHKMTTTNAFTQGQKLLSSILHQMSDLGKVQRKFLLHTFLLCLRIRGRFNFMQMSRQSTLHEQTYRNRFSDSFDFLRFNILLANSHCSDQTIIAFDPSFISKSGKHTPDIGFFYSGCASKYKKGLEIGGFALVDMKKNTAFHLLAVQTPKASKNKMKGERTLVDHYSDILKQNAPQLLELSSILAADGYFAKNKYVKAACECGFTLVSRLRDDADLRYLYKGAKKGTKGRPPKYDGKINLKQIDKRRFSKEGLIDNLIVYSAIVYSKSLKREIRIAYVEILGKANEVIAYKVFFSTDIEIMTGIEIVKIYKSRFQIEFLYRDAKQYTGLEHCQARNKKKLHFHFNTSLTSVSIGKILHEKSCRDPNYQHISIYDIKTELNNRYMANRIISMFGLNPNLIINKPEYEELLNLGKIAA